MIQVKSANVSYVQSFCLGSGKVCWEMSEWSGGHLQGVWGVTYRTILFQHLYTAWVVILDAAARLPLSISHPLSQFGDWRVPPYTRGKLCSKVNKSCLQIVRALSCCCVWCQISSCQTSEHTLTELGPIQKFSCCTFSTLSYVPLLLNTWKTSTVNIPTILSPIVLTHQHLISAYWYPLGTEHYLDGSCSQLVYHHLMVIVW